MPDAPENRRKPSASGVKEAVRRVAGKVVRTPLLPFECNGLALWAKAECLQTGGSFKLRGATNRLMQLSQEERQRGVVAFSSGNHAQGVALAAGRLGMPATIVMPYDAPAVKRDATLAAGASIRGYDRATESREEIAAALAERAGATLVPSFDDVDVIEGQGTTGIEIGGQMGEQAGGPPDLIVIPCGGGGLAAGIALAVPEARIVVAEPEGWDDMARSLAAGQRLAVPDDAPTTWCDALQTKLVSPVTFDVLLERRATGVAVSDAETAEAMRFAMRNLRLVVEPGGATALAAVLAGLVEPAQRTAVVLSGGNVDPALYAAVVAPAMR